MAKSPKKNRRKQVQAVKAQAAAADPAMSRRKMLGLARNGAIGIALLGGAGYVGTGWYHEWAAEHDLSRIGQGTPTVVQVHDPQCPVCVALQGEIRTALRQLDDPDLLYLVADIKQEKGAAFAAKHNVPHVTVVLLDGAGEVTQILRGMHTSDELTAILTQHARRS